MTDLTDKWKKGELPDGWYWVEGSRAEGIYAYTAEYLNNMYRPRNGERIIEQVPSYEEYLSLTYAKEEDEGLIAEYEEENTKLKELLKECKKILCESQTTNPIVYFRWENDLINKIDEVLK